MWRYFPTQMQTTIPCKKPQGIKAHCSSCVFHLVCREVWEWVKCVSSRISNKQRVKGLGSTETNSLCVHNTQPVPWEHNRIYRWDFPPKPVKHKFNWSSQSHSHLWKKVQILWIHFREIMDGSKQASLHVTGLMFYYWLFSQKKPNNITAALWDHLYKKLLYISIMI